jgi:hypothetical protein
MALRTRRELVHGLGVIRVWVAVWGGIFQTGAFYGAFETRRIGSFGPR